MPGTLTVFLVSPFTVLLGIPFSPSFLCLVPTPFLVYTFTLMEHKVCGKEMVLRICMSEDGFILPSYQTDTLNGYQIQDQQSFPLEFEGIFSVVS